MEMAVIFDMNGVVINDERIHQQSWREFCKKHDLQITEDEFKHNVFGRTEKDTFEYLLKREISPEDLENLSNKRVDKAIAIFKPNLKMTECLDKLLESLNNAEIPMAIATSSRRRYTNFILDGLNIRNYFEVVVTAEDITKGKPDPEIYLKAAKLLNVEPKNCVVFEDALSGIISAKNAGMKVIAIATTHQKDKLQSADKVISTFEEINPKILASLL